MTLPSSCLVGDVKDNRGKIFVVKDNTVKLVTVVIASDNGRQVEVLSGLAPTDTVVIGPPAGLSDGSAVVAVPGTTEAG